MPLCIKLGVVIPRWNLRQVKIVTMAKVERTVGSTEVPLPRKCGIKFPTLKKRVAIILPSSACVVIDDERSSAHALSSTNGGVHDIQIYRTLVRPCLCFEVYESRSAGIVCLCHYLFLATIPSDAASMSYSIARSRSFSFVHGIDTNRIFGRSDFVTL